MRVSQLIGTLLLLNVPFFGQSVGGQESQTQEIRSQSLSPEQAQQLQKSLSPEQAEQLKSLQQQDLTLPVATQGELALNPAAVSAYLKSHGIDPTRLPKSADVEKIEKQVAKYLQQQTTTKRLIDAGNPPFLLLNGPNAIKLIEGFQYPKPPALPASVAKAAGSIGRIEDSNKTLVGTGWVIGDGIIVTNCHVVLHMVDPVDGVTIPQNTFYIDFGAADVHLPAQEFAINKALFVSAEKGLDIALLGVSKVAADSQSHLPERLTLKNPESFPANGYFVGYASGTQNSSSLDTQKLRDALAPLGRSAKIASFVDITTAVEVSDFGILLHNASTHYGSSGSPLLDSDGEVTGLHYCCNTANDITPGDTCSSTTVVTPYNNQAIAASAFQNIADIRKIVKPQ